MGALATGAAASPPLNYAAIASARRLPMAKDGRFDMGVASGLPAPPRNHALDPPRRHQAQPNVRLMVATDRKFKNVVEERNVVAAKKRGFTARTFVNGLKPKEEYFYRFFTEDSKSPVGRFRTAPPLKSKEHDPDRLLLLPEL